MNYHVEHHMFPLVPYHALPKLHQAVKEDMPIPYPSLFAAWAEIVPTILRQVKDPAYHVKRVLPEPRSHTNEGTCSSDAEPDKEGWIEVCAAADLGPSDVIRFDHGLKTFALIRDEERQLYATDGVCTHGNTHLADGLVKGKIIECPKHNGRFNLADGSPASVPVCRGLATYPIEERKGRLYLNIVKPGGLGAREQKAIHQKVVINHRWHPWKLVQSRS
jgi:MocE subfamily Rieske [2Fe-2S] domain protein